MSRKHKELLLDPYYIEYAMGDWFVKASTPSERRWVYSAHRPARLEKAGYLYRREDHPHARSFSFETIWYWPTPAGLTWWIGERAKLVEGKCWRPHDHYDHCFQPAQKYVPQFGKPALYRPYTLEDLLPAVEGKGIGSHTTFFASHNPTVWVAMRDGLLDFVSHRDYSGAPHNNEEYVTAALTSKGMAYFDSIPRLQLEFS